jgi:predicted phosphodiesterase
MKIAVLSDIHGNVPALEAVLDDIASWRADEVIVNGDLVSRGPYSLRCLRRLQQRCPQARCLKGNHETFVLACADTPMDPTDPTVELGRFAYWTAAQLGPALDAIRGFGEHIDRMDLDGGSVHVTHGSRLGDRDGIRAETPDADLPAKLGDPRTLFIASHTHRPMLRRFNGTLIANVGSVGQPFDGDPRAAYGRFVFDASRWHASIARVSYDRSQAARDFADSGFLDEGGPLARLIYLEWQQARAHVGLWRTRYLHQVRSGARTATQAVEEYLASL